MSFQLFESLLESLQLNPQDVNDLLSKILGQLVTNGYLDLDYDRERGKGSHAVLIVVFQYNNEEYGYRVSFKIDHITMYHDEYNRFAPTGVEEVFLDVIDVEAGSDNPNNKESEYFKHKLEDNSIPNDIIYSLQPLKREFESSQYFKQHLESERDYD